MRRTCILLMVLVPFGAASSAQAPAIRPPSSSFPAGASAEQMVARVMSFDRDSDGKVAKEELLERMKDLVARGDTDGDGALDGHEIRALATTPAATRGGGFGFPAMYRLPAESWFPERSHIEGAISDLKLGSDAHARAVAVVEAHQQHVKTAARAAGDHLLRDMETLLTAEQLADFKAALESPGPRHILRLRLPAGGGSVPGGVVANALLFFDGALSGAFHGGVTPGGDLARLINRYGLTVTKGREALTAIVSYQATLDDLGEVERRGLVEQMRDILTEEERDDFRAALDRRSALPIGVVGGVVSGTVPPLPR
jgi:hypothetical protein